MTDSQPASESPDAPEIYSWLSSFLDRQRADYEEQFAAPGSDDEHALHRSIDDLSRWAKATVTSAVVPHGLDELLNDFMPGDSIEMKVRVLMGLPVVRHRLEFDVADEVCGHLHDVHQRIEQVVLMTQYRVGYKLSMTARKYFERATRLFLAGYSAETVIMCGAVLEAALRARVPDEQLVEANIKPVFKNGDFSLAQRLRYVKNRHILTEDQGSQADDLVNWRNDAVHVQPDIGPRPVQALSRLAMLLPVLLPADEYSG